MKVRSTLKEIPEAFVRFLLDNNLPYFSRLQIRFGYDAENHQTGFFDASNSGSTPDATYQYDGEGRRVKKVSAAETTVFVYDGGGQIVAEYSTALAVTQQVSYLTTDHLGSPRVITDQNGAVTSRKDFTAFGEEVTSSQRVSGTSGNGYDAREIRQDYTGYQKDEESGLEFAQARYYNTVHGRFTSVDPLTASASIRNPQTFNTPHFFVRTGKSGNLSKSRKSRRFEKMPITGGG